MSLYNEYLMFIYKVDKFLRRIGITVIYESDEVPRGNLGKIVYEKREIHLREQDIRLALMTILHEAGHWFSRLFFFYRYPNYNQRESWAKSFGWLFLKSMKCPERLVDYKLWNKFHKE